jgi:hypothetical protein
MTMQNRPPFAMISLVLPGPDRKRMPVPYHYRLTFRAANPHEPGCAATWEIYGGREEYQLVLERTAGGELLWHCSCADAVYRARDGNPHYCKHIRALKDLFSLVISETGPAEPRPSVLAP